MAWLALSSCPARWTSQIVMIDNELYVSEESDPFESQIINNKIWRYLIGSNEWTSRSLSVCLSQSQNCILIWNHPSNALIEYNFQSNLCTSSYIQHNIGAYPQMVDIDGVIHIVGGGNNNKHITYKRSSHFAEYTYDEIYEFQNISNKIMGHRLIFDPKRRKMLLFGGDFGVQINSASHTFSNDVYEYIEYGNQWNMIPTKMPTAMANFGVSASKNCDYIYIFGGNSDGLVVSDQIWIYSSNTKTFDKSCGICPEKGIFHSVISNDDKKDELLTFGYINYLFESPTFLSTQKLPFYLIHLVNKFMIKEYVFLLGNGSGNLWQSDLDDLRTETKKYEQQIQKEAFVEIFNSRKWKKGHRTRYIEGKQPSDTPIKGVDYEIFSGFYLCLHCDHMAEHKYVEFGHIKTKHFTLGATPPNVMSGQHFMWNKLCDDQFYCLKCKCIGVPVTIYKKVKNVMEHGKIQHNGDYIKLL